MLTDNETPEARLGQLVRAARKRMRLNLEQGAEAVGLSPETLGYIERARNNRGRVYQTSDADLSRIAAEFHIPAGELEKIGRDGAARLLESLPAEPAVADASLLAAADDFFDAFAGALSAAIASAGGRADLVLPRLWYRSFDADGRLKPLEHRMRDVTDWLSRPRGGEAESSEGTG